MKKRSSSRTGKAMWSKPAGSDTSTSGMLGAAAAKIKGLHAASLAPDGGKAGATGALKKVR